jgi:hypothetical protein
MSDMSIIHLLKISGMISEKKKREFENTVKYACGLIPDECLEKSLSAEIFEPDTYYFFSSWSSESALIKFMKLEPYQLIRSAFDILGVLHKIEIGYHVEIKTIRISH